MIDSWIDSLKYSHSTWKKSLSTSTMSLAACVTRWPWGIMQVVHDVFDWNARAEAKALKLQLAAAQAQDWNARAEAKALKLQLAAAQAQANELRAWALQVPIFGLFALGIASFGATQPFGKQLKVERELISTSVQIKRFK